MPGISSFHIKNLRLPVSPQELLSLYPPTLDKLYFHCHSVPNKFLKNGFGWVWWCTPVSLACDTLSRKTENLKTTWDKLWDVVSKQHFPLDVVFDPRCLRNFQSSSFTYFLFNFIISLWSGNLQAVFNLLVFYCVVSGSECSSWWISVGHEEDAYFTLLGWISL